MTAPMPKDDIIAARVASDPPPFSTINIGKSALYPEIGINIIPANNAWRINILELMAVRTPSAKDLERDTAWASIISTMNAHTQRMFPPELRSRVIGIYMMVFYAALTLGSVLSGRGAQKIGIGNILYELGMLLIFIGILTLALRFFSIKRFTQRGAE
jgi:MFS family permease